MDTKRSIYIDTLSVGRLVTAEDLGYLSLLKDVLVKLPLETSAPGFSPKLKTAVDEFNAALTDFDVAFKDADKLPTVAAAAKNDTLRDKAWSAMFGFVRGAFKHPNEEIATIAEEALVYFNTYGNMLRMNQTKETGLLDNLIADLKGMGDAKLTKAGLKPFLDDLEQKELDYRASVSARSDEEGERLLGIVKEKRAAADAAYRNLVDMINALIRVNGDAPFQAFVKNVNALIKRQEEQIALRQTNAKKRNEKKPKDPKDPKQPKDPKDPKKPEGGGDDIQIPSEPPKKPDDAEQPKPNPGGQTGGGDDIQIPSEPPKKPDGQ